MSTVSGQTVLLDIDQFAMDVDIANMDVISDPFISADIYFELGNWLAGLETFCTIGNVVFHSRSSERRSEERKYLAEFSICRAVLLRCSELTYLLRSDTNTDPEFVRSTLFEIERFIPDSLVLCNALARSPEPTIDVWNVWRKLLAERLRHLKVVRNFDRDYKTAGSCSLPDVLRSLLNSESISRDDRRDLRRYLPGFGGILKSLAIVKRMLDHDMPIRPSLVIFSHIYETIDSLIRDMNDRLAVHPDESSEMFAVTDASSYTLSMDRKKIFGQELAAVLEIRSATNAFARVESAYSVLNDNICQLLAGFAQIVRPDAESSKIFPEFRAKLDNSINLRSRLWAILRSVREAENELTDEALDRLHSELRSFRDDHLSLLFYKDRETFERFCTEIDLTANKEDAGPIIHRFSAYVETLFSLVQMRAVLANHPMTAGK